MTTLPDDLRRYRDAYALAIIDGSPPAHADVCADLSRLLDPPAPKEAPACGDPTGEWPVRMDCKVIDVLNAGESEGGLSCVEVVGSDGGPEGFNLFLLAGRADDDWRGRRFVLTLTPAETPEAL